MNIWSRQRAERQAASGGGTCSVLGLVLERELLSGYPVLPVRRKGRRVHKMDVYLSLKVSMINLYQGCAVFRVSSAMFGFVMD